MVSHIYMMFWLDSRTDGSLAENGSGGRTLSFVKAHNGFSLYPAALLFSSCTSRKLRISAKITAKCFVLFIIDECNWNVNRISTN